MCLQANIHSFNAIFFFFFCPCVALAFAWWEFTYSAIFVLPRHTMTDWCENPTLRRPCLRYVFFLGVLPNRNWRIELPKKKKKGIDVWNTNKIGHGFGPCFKPTRSLGASLMWPWLNSLFLHIYINWARDMLYGGNIIFCFPSSIYISILLTKPQVFTVL